MKIVGSGQYFNRFEDALRQDFKDIADGVDITSWVTPDRMPEVLAGADIGLLPLADPSRWVQSKSPTKLFEYMSTGMPVMAFNNGEVRHVIENEISGFLAEDEDSYGDYLTRLAEDPDLRARIGQNARRRIENQFSLHHICERLYWALHRN